MNRDQLADRLRGIFLAELEEQTHLLNHHLLALEAAPGDAGGLDSLFRIMHTLKGASHAAHVPQVEEVCHTLETLLASVRAGKRTLGAEEFSLLFAAADALTDGGQRLRAGGSLTESPLAELARSLRASSTGPKQEPGSATRAPVPAPQPTPPPTRQADPATPPPPAPVADPGREQVRVEAEKLDALLAGTGELLTLAQRVEARPPQLGALHEWVNRWSLDWRRTAHRVHHLLVDPRIPATVRHELETVEENLRHMVQETGRLEVAAREDARALSQIAGEMGDRVRRLRLRPFSDACLALPRAVRDLASLSGKEVHLEVEGGEVQADRAVLDVLNEVLLHLVRNAVDHGIETPPERERAGKPRMGTITVAAKQRGRRLVISVADDGRGVDLDAIRAQLERSGQRAPESPEELARALFRPGLSTRTEATTISGRGVGLDVVRTTIERIRGSVQVSWVDGRGTTFALECPPSLATLRALLVGVGPQLLAVPTVHVEHLVQLRPEEVRSAEGRDVILTSGAPVPLVSLARLLGPPMREPSAEGPLRVVRLQVGDRRLAVAVDELVTEEEIVVRPLERINSLSAFFSGASLLATGKVALVLNASAVVDAGLGNAAAGAALRKRGPAAPARKRVLVVDDSITTRSLEQSILQAAGYEVLTAVDGSDAWQLLGESDVDLVVSDVEMPRMDGFELCAAIRASQRHAGLPLILVTGLDSPEHRAHGLELGADAYLPKSSFDQQALLDTIRQLLG